MLKDLKSVVVEGDGYVERRRGGILSTNKLKRRRILVVDDEDTVGIGVSSLLNDAGFDANYVVSGKAAIKEIKEGQISLVFMDMVMPGMNGLETYRMLRFLNAGVKVVIFTGFFKDVESMISQGVKEGMLDLYIRKPFYAEEIINVAKKYA